MEGWILETDMNSKGLGSACRSWLGAGLGLAGRWSLSIE